MQNENMQKIGIEPKPKKKFTPHTLTGRTGHLMYAILAYFLLNQLNLGQADKSIK